MAETLATLVVNSLAIGTCAWVLIQFIKHYGDK